MLLIFIIGMMLLTEGSFCIFEYHFRWNSLIKYIINPELQGRWLWFGDRKAYGKFLDEEKKRVTDLTNNK